MRSMMRCLLPKADWPDPAPGITGKEAPLFAVQRVSMISNTETKACPNPIAKASTLFQLHRDEVSGAGFAASALLARAAQGFGERAAAPRRIRLARRF